VGFKITFLSLNVHFGSNSVLDFWSSNFREHRCQKLWQLCCKSKRIFKNRFNGRFTAVETNLSLASIPQWQSHIQSAGSKDPNRQWLAFSINTDAYVYEIVTVEWKRWRVIRWGTIQKPILHVSPPRYNWKNKQHYIKWIQSTMHNNMREQMSE
jgi:hypothetical protein